MTTLEQFEALGDIISSGDIEVNEAAQLQELYIIKLKCFICMLEINVNNFSEGKKLTYTLNHKPKEIILEKNKRQRNKKHFF